MNLPTYVVNQLKEHQVLNLAYTDEDGVQACAVFYVYTVENTLVFISSKKTRHGAAFSKGNTEVGFTINKDDQSWDTIRGIQGKGVVTLVDDNRLDRMKRVYLNRFPFIVETQKLRNMVTTIDFWELKPRWLRYIDNQVKFAHKEEFNSPEFP